MVVLEHTPSLPCPHTFSPSSSLHFLGARTYCIINEQDQLNATGSCTIDKNSKKIFSASENKTWLYRIVLLHMFQKVAEDFRITCICTEQWKILEKSCSVVDSTALNCLIVKTLCFELPVKLFVMPRNFYLSTFKGRNCWVRKFFDKLMLTFWHLLHVHVTSFTVSQAI